MTNKKFSIRKLAIGTASVAIGFSDRFYTC